MKIPYLINLILLFLFSTSCVHLQFLVGDNPDGEKKNEIKELEITKEKENSFNVSSKLLEEKDLVINELTFEVKKLRAELIESGVILNNCIYYLILFRSISNTSLNLISLI